MGKVIRYVCDCGYQGEDLRVGLGDGAAEEVLEVRSRACPRCGSLRAIGTSPFGRAVAPEEDDPAACPRCRGEAVMLRHPEGPLCPLCGARTRTELRGNWR